jgi:DNA-binding beta-propeller fold protein YncE
MIQMAVVSAVFASAGLFGGAPPGQASLPADDPEATYWVYVLAESADRIHRIRFGPEGAVVENTAPIGMFPVTMEGPHGIQVSPRKDYFYVTTGHGIPDGKFWKFEVGADRPVTEAIDLGYFPATLDVTPDGLYAFIVNFNLHGSMVPSTVSTVYLPSFQEVAQTETCTMPHGSRVSPDGLHHYSVCMMDDQLVEISTRDFEVSRRFSLVQGEEGPLALEHMADHADHDAHADHHAERPPETGDRRAHDPAGMGSHGSTCTPTWVHPAPDGERLYVTCSATDEILEIDREGWELLRRFPTGRGPYNLEVTADNRLLVVTLKQGHGVEFIDLASGESLAMRESSTRVTHGVVTSPDARYAFISVEGVGAEPGKVDIYDLRTFERVASVEVRQQAAGIAFLRMEPAP